jgi:acetate kinase
MATSGPILVFNSGSSSLKLGLFRAAGADVTAVLSGEVNGIGHGTGHLVLKNADGSALLCEDHTIASQEEGLSRLTHVLREHYPETPVAVGHRVVHGGPRLREHTMITPEVMQQLEAATHFAPLHIPEALRIIRKAQELFPQTPQMACFDTTFHRTMPKVATHLPLPSRYYAAGVQRYGFHGLSCESVLHRIPQPLPEKIVIAHLGGGSSVTAVLCGESRDTSMGLSPTGGVPMSLRTGDLDPAVLLYLMRTEQLSADAIETMVNHECGLFALSNGESDMQALLARKDKDAALAIDVFVMGVRKAIGGYAAVLGGIDLLVFTGGIGEHAGEIRRRILDGFGFMQMPRVAVLPAEEEVQIARHCVRLLRGDASG